LEKSPFFVPLTEFWRSKTDADAYVARQVFTGRYTLICNPRTLANASPIPSQTVGCA
jgi:hypothetical protein